MQTKFQNIMDCETNGTSAVFMIADDYTTTHMSYEDWLDLHNSFEDWVDVMEETINHVDLNNLPF